MTARGNLPEGWVRAADGRHLPPFAAEAAIGLAKGPGAFWYLGSPYSKYGGGLEAAAIGVCRARAWLVRQGVPCFSPIAHSHWVAVHGGLDPLDHGIWLPAEAPIMAHAVGLIVLGLEGWDSSAGLAHELAAFGRSGRPTWFLEAALVGT